MLSTRSTAPRDTGRDGLPRRVVAAAALWSALLAVAGTVALSGANGPLVAITCSVPLALVAVFAGLVVLRGRRGRRGPGPLAWAVVAACGAFVVVGMLTIGLFFLPTLGCLLVAAGRLQERGAVGL